MDSIWKQFHCKLLGKLRFSEIEILINETINDKIDFHIERWSTIWFFSFFGVFRGSLVASLQQCADRSTVIQVIDGNKTEDFTSRLWWIYWFAERSVKRAFNDSPKRHSARVIVFIALFGVFFLFSFAQSTSQGMTVMAKSLFEVSHRPHDDLNRRWAVNNLKCSWRKLSISRGERTNRAVKLHKLLHCVCVSERLDHTGVDRSPRKLPSRLTTSRWGKGKRSEKMPQKG